MGPTQLFSAPCDAKPGARTRPHDWNRPRPKSKGLGGVCASMLLQADAANTRSNPDCSESGSKSNTSPPPVAFRGGSAPIAQDRLLELCRRAGWRGVRFSDCGRGAGGFLSARAAGPLGVACRRRTPDCAAIHCSRDSVFGWSSRHRYRGERPGTGTRRRRCALRRVRRRPRRVVDCASWRCALKLRTSVQLPARWSCRQAR